MSWNHFNAPRCYLEAVPIFYLTHLEKVRSFLPDRRSLLRPLEKLGDHTGPLPVWSTIGEALQAIAKAWKPLLKAIAVPSVILAAISVEGDFSDYDSLRALVRFLISPILLTLIAVSCHRLLILGVGSLPNTWGFFWTRRETRFLGWSLKLLFGWIVFAGSFFLLSKQLGGARVMDIFHSFLALGNLLLTLLFAPFILCSMYVGARLSLLLTATAVDQESTPRTSWGLSRGNGWRLTTILFLPAVLFLPIDVAASRVLPGFASQTLLALVGGICGILGIASLSKAFCWFSEDALAVPTDS